MAWGQVVKVVPDELMELLGGSGHRLAMAPHPPTVIMLMGLQGSGKTTSAAKLARHFQRQGQHPLLAAADVYRPAAVEPLRGLGGQLPNPARGRRGPPPPPPRTPGAPYTPRSRCSKSSRCSSARCTHTTSSSSRTP